MTAEKETLESIDQIGPAMAQSIYEYFRDEKKRAVIDELLTEGLQPAQPRQKPSGKLNGKTIVVTGTLENLTRQQAEQQVRQAGGKTSSSLSRKTNFLLTGKNPGSKFDKAQKLGVKVIDEKEFLEMINS